MIRANVSFVNHPLHMTTPLPPWRNKMLDWLRRQTASPTRALKRFTTGGFVFSAGMMMILLAHQLMDPGIGQELAVLAGLCILVAGGIYTLSGYLAISLFRILRYLLEPSNDRSQ